MIDAIRTTRRTVTAAATLLTLSVGTALTAACVDDDESPFARFAAFFRFAPVTSAPKTLMPALSSPGEWCTVTTSGMSYAFRSATGMTDTFPIVLTPHSGAALWIGGLIVGTPTVPEIGSTAFAPVCYDIVCPACYEESGITRGVSITDPALGRATCTRCHTVYDLHNSGVVVEGATRPKAPRLYRYRCTYTNDTFVVQN